MKLRKAGTEELDTVRAFYWDVIDLMDGAGIGWIKGIYPSDAFLSESLEAGGLYVLDGSTGFDAAVIVNSATNEGYNGTEWQIDCPDGDVLIPHALAVHPSLHGRGVGRTVVDDIIEIARGGGKKAVRLDVLAGNTAAERLYTGKGFQFIESKTMFYEDTGWTEFTLFELVL